MYLSTSTHEMYKYIQNVRVQVQIHFSAMYSVQILCKVLEYKYEYILKLFLCKVGKCNKRLKLLY